MKMYGFAWRNGHRKGADMFSEECDRDYAISEAEGYGCEIALFTSALDLDPGTMFRPVPEFETGPVEPEATP